MTMDETPEEAVQRQAAEVAARLAAANAARATADAAASTFSPADQAQAQLRVASAAGIDSPEGLRRARQQYAAQGIPAQASAPPNVPVLDGRTYRRAESENTDELMRGHEEQNEREARAREVSMYNLLRGVADTGYDNGAPIPPPPPPPPPPEKTLNAPTQLTPEQKQQSQLQA